MVRHFSVFSSDSSRLTPRKAKPIAALPGLLILTAAASLALTLAPLASATEEESSTPHRATIATQEDPPPVTAMGQTYLLSPGADPTIGATAWPMVGSVPGTPGPTFVPAVSMPVSIEQTGQGGQGGNGMTVVWTLSIGTLIDPSGQSIPAGTLRADVSFPSLDPAQPGCTTMAAISAIPQSTAVAIQQSLATATFLPPPQQEDEQARDFCLGTTCSCGTCSNGHRFSAPLFVVGRCNETVGVNCCGAACQVMCNLLAGGMSPTEAWIQGQGQFVICVIAHPEV